MTMTLMLWFALSVACDVSGQLCLKIGADNLPEVQGRELAMALLCSAWVAGGVLIYIVEIFVWLRILAEVPLSIAFPIASLNFLGVTIASAIFLKEPVGRRQWAGATLITLGVLVVARTA
jgi:undecaprenyl phosphate-alpha-L-ara4N flippase subunit ArnE